MDNGIVCSRINKLLSDAGYSLHFNSVADIENYLAKRENFGHETYEIIEQLYSQLMEDTQL